MSHFLIDFGTFYTLYFIISLKFQLLGQQPMNNPSPLRYPGGKFKIAPVVKKIIEKAVVDKCIYIEPFAGGAGIAVDLLLSDFVDEIVINDYDRAISSFWRAILYETDDFLRLIENTPVTINEWHKQRLIYEKSRSYSLEYGFATFFLNRTNHSGILSAGPIGGLAQDQDEWKLDARYNKDELVSRILAISQQKDRIHCYNQDIISFICRYLPKYQKRGFVYFDPPYFCKGKRLYKSFFTQQYHQTVAEHIFSNVKCDWIVSYDDVPDVKDIYDNYTSIRFSLSYSLANKGQGREVMFFKSPSLCPSMSELSAAGLKFAVWE